MPRPVVLHRDYFVSNQRSQYDINREMLQTFVGGLQVPSVTGIGFFWNIVPFMQTKAFIHVTSTEQLVQVMRGQQFMEAVLVLGPKANGAFGAQPGGFGASGDSSELFSYYVQDRCDFGLAVQPVYDFHSSRMKMRCASPRS